MPKQRVRSDAPIARLIDSFPGYLKEFQEALRNAGGSASLPTIRAWRMKRGRPEDRNLNALASVFQKTTDQILELLADHPVVPVELASASHSGNQNTEAHFVIEKIHLNKERFPEVMERRFDELLERCERFVFYTRLCNYVRNDNDTHVDTYDLGANRQFRARVENGEVRFIRVESFFSRARFEKAIEEGLYFRAISPGSYECRYYLSPPRGIPILNFRSWDDRFFYLGGFYPGKHSIDDDVGLVIHAQEPFTSFFQNYRRAVAINSEPLLNDDLTNVQRIAKSLGYSDEDLSRLRQKIVAWEEKHRKKANI